MSSTQPVKKKKHAWRNTLIGLLLLVPTFYIWNSYIDRQLAHRDPSAVYQSCFKIWATRGLVVNRPRTDSRAGNSLASLSRAFANGAEGSEIDLYYETTLNRFVISHDLPYNEHSGELLFLEDIFQHAAPGKYFWLDFKKLRKLDDDAVNAAATRLQTIAYASNLQDRIYVEGEDPFNLGVFRDAGFKTIYDTHPLPESYPLTRLVLGAYKLVFYYGNFSVMGMPAGETDDPIYVEVAQKTLRHVPMFIYHAPQDTQTLKRLLADQQVRVIIMGDHSLNLYSENACAPNTDN